MPKALNDFSAFTHLTISPKLIYAVESMILDTTRLFENIQQNYLEKRVKQGNLVNATSASTHNVYIAEQDALSYTLEDTFRLLAKVPDAYLTASSFQRFFIGAFIIALKNIHYFDGAFITDAWCLEHLQKAELPLSLPLLNRYQQDLLSAINYAIPSTPARAELLPPAKDDWLETPGYTIHSAVQQNNLARVKHMIAADPHALNALDFFGQTPLIWAASLGLTDIVRYLLTQETIDLGAKTQCLPHDPDKSMDGMSACDWAILKNHPDIIELLTERGLKQTLETRHMQILQLHLAAREGNRAKLIALLQADSSLIESREQDRTPLHWTIMNQHWTCATLLIATYHADVNALTPIVDSQASVITEAPLDLLFKNAKTKEGMADALALAELLAVNGAITKGQPTHFGDLTIHNAISHANNVALHQNNAITQLLVKYNPALINAHSSQGLTPLHIAVYRDNTLLTKWFVDHGADLSLLTQLGKKQPVDMTALAIAAREGNSIIFDYLLNASHQILTVSRLAHAQPLLLDWAFKGGNLDIIDALQTLGIRAKAPPTRVGKHSLSQLCANNDRESVELVLRENPDVLDHDHPNSFKPVHFAVIHGASDVIELLLDRSSITIFQQLSTEKNAFQRPLNALDLAFIFRRADIVELLENQGIKPTLSIRDCQQIYLWQALEKDDLAEINILLHATPHLVNSSYHGLTPLQWAVANGRFMLSEYLITQWPLMINHDLSKRHPTSKALLKTPLDLAYLQGDIAIITLLSQQKAKTNYLHSRIGQHTIHELILKGDEHASQLLIFHHSALRKHVDAHGFTPLHLALSRQMFALSRLLITKGARGTGKTAAFIDDERLAPLAQMSAYDIARYYRAYLTPTEPTIAVNYDPLLKTLAPSFANRCTLFLPKNPIIAPTTTVIPITTTIAPAIPVNKTVLLLTQAAAQGHSAIFWFLNQTGVNLHEVHDNKSYLDIACQHEQTATIELLRTLGVTTQNGQASWHDKGLLLLIKERNYDAITALLLGNPTLVNQRHQQCFTPLHLVALLGYSELIPLLINLGADLDARLSTAFDKHFAFAAFALMTAAEISASQSHRFPDHKGHSACAQQLLAFRQERPTLTLVGAIPSNVGCKLIGSTQALLTPSASTMHMNPSINNTTTNAVLQ